MHRQEIYYLDFHALYKYTDREGRAEIRRALTQDVRDELMAHRLKMQRNICFYCGDPIDMSAHLDHLIPVAYGGTNKKTNLVAACKDCNMFKMTGQIEITNIYTITDYQKLQEAFKKWSIKVAGKPHHKLRRYVPKRVRLYRLYRADLFRKIPMRVSFCVD